MARYLLKPQFGFSRIVQVGIFIRQPHDSRHDKKEYEFYCSDSIVSIDRLTVFVFTNEHRPKRGTF